MCIGINYKSYILLRDIRQTQNLATITIDVKFYGYKYIYIYNHDIR